MSRAGTGTRLALWLLFVGLCTVGFTPTPLDTIPGLGHRTYYEVLLLLALALGLAPLLRLALQPIGRVARTVSRIIIAYLLFEGLVVVPVALWIGAANPGQVLATMGIRLTWLLFPVLIVVCEDPRAMRLAAAGLAAAAAALVAWGLYAAATGGGGYYIEFGQLRYRVLSSGATLLVAWPFVLVVSGVVKGRAGGFLLAIAAVGVVLTGHRADLIAFAGAGLVCLGFSGQYRRALAALLPLALAGSVIAFIWGRDLWAMFGYTITHLLDASSGNGADRVRRWALAWEFLRTHPLNDWVWSWRRYTVALNLGYEPHNFILEIGQTEGLAGLAFYGTTLGAVLRAGWTWARQDAEVRALLGWLVVYIIFSLLNANHYLETSMPLLVAACAALAARVDRLASLPGSQREVGQGVGS